MGISDLVKRMKLGQEKLKPSIDLLVAIQQDCDVSRHNLHVLARPKHQEIEGKPQGQNQTPQALEITQIQRKGGGEGGFRSWTKLAKQKLRLLSRI